MINSMYKFKHSIRGRWYSCQFLLLAWLAIFLLGCRSTYAESLPLSTAIPAQSDWLECGPIFHAGTEGAWDTYLWGGFAASVVKKDGLFYLYYQGANGYDDDEGTVTYRAIGVATSTDGYSFTKYTGNPILTWFPNDNLEEGAVSGGAFLNEDEDIAIYYGANNWIGGSQVNADGRLATSSDGLHFTDQGIVLDHNNSALWGSGDEMFPVIGFQDNGRYFTYYIPNGVLQRGQLGAAWGSSLDQLTNSAAARSGTRSISVWGPGSFAKVGPDVYALFLNDVYAANGPTLEVRAVSLDTPSNLSTPVQSYQFDNVWEAIVYLDEETDTWFLFYRSADHDYYGVKIAAADGRALSCPDREEQYHPLIEEDSSISQSTTCRSASSVR